MKRLELTVPTSLLDDLEILSDRFFRHNRSVQVLQSFSLRPQTNALIVRVHRKGPFKDEATVRREARAIARRYRVSRFEILSTDRTRGEYVAWIEWRLPERLRGLLGEEWSGAGAVDPAAASLGPPIHGVWFIRRRARSDAIAPNQVRSESQREMFRLPYA